MIFVSVQKRQVPRRNLGIEDKRASLATLAHGAKKTPKTLDEMTEVAQVIDCATAVVDKVNAQLGLPVAAEGRAATRGGEGDAA